ncbi:MAG TPA: serine/threonine-protein kinase, partial [Bacteroidota bacterium]|nr:serine/threonine-protein kinase [Bacteroidota bacterium]
MIGRTISHYAILEKLGEGGMGVVYKARDLSLDRIVALKFLPPHLAQDDAEESRLLQEARAASRLNHPGICAIHAIGENDGAHFIDLEYIDGRTMGAVIREGRLPVAEAVGYAIQACEALHEAHANGIVHRDIKSENLMVTSRDRLKVMDFGLARLKGSTRLTKPHSTLGTLAYMAPEQIQGGEADSRSDMFSFGVVFYEMLSGALPFRGDHEAAVIYSIAHGTAEPLSRIRPDVPLELERIVSRALEKDPAARYQNAEDMASELRRLSYAQSPATASVDQRVVPVTPAIPVPTAPTAPLPDPGGAPAQGSRGPGARRVARQVVPIVLGILAIVLAWIYLRGGAGGARVDSGGRKILVVLPFENLGT